VQYLDWQPKKTFSKQGDCWEGWRTRVTAIHYLEQSRQSVRQLSSVAQCISELDPMQQAPEHGPCALT